MGEEKFVSSEAGTTAEQLLSAPNCAEFRASIISESTAKEESRVTLNPRGEGRGRLRRVGDRVRHWEIAHIGSIGWSHRPSVWLSHEGQLCRAKLSGPLAPAAVSRLEPGSYPGRFAVKPTAPDFARHVQRISDTEFVVEREIVQLALSASAQHLGRLAPEYDDGKLVGYRVFALRPSSLGYELGIRNGDRIDLVNGKSLADAHELIAVLGVLNSADHVDAQIQRGGEALEISYRLN
jgi:hypothetical protein